jgi:diaminopimelate epimerase
MKQCLAEACQNTFVLFDCLEISHLNDEIIQIAHRRLKEEDRDDALILLDGSVTRDSFSVRMVVLGLDGTFGEYCGNGARAAAAYLFANYASYREISLRTERSVQRLSKLGEGIFSVTLPSVSFGLNQKFIASGSMISPFEYVEAIEPHLVIEKKMSDEELTSIGRELNQNKEKFPLGININAYHFLEDGRVFVKTYERGVQRLTKSCGTGSVSCAASVMKKQGKLGRVDIVTPGGSLIVIVRENEIELCGEGKA